MVFFCCTSRLCHFLCRLSPSLSPPVWLSNKAETFTYTSLYLAIPAAGCGGGYTLALLPPPFPAAPKQDFLSLRPSSHFSYLERHSPTIGKKKLHCARKATSPAIGQEKLPLFPPPPNGRIPPQRAWRRRASTLYHGGGERRAGVKGARRRDSRTVGGTAPPPSPARTLKRRKSGFVRPLRSTSPPPPLLLGGERGKSCTAVLYTVREPQVMEGGGEPFK